MQGDSRALSRLHVRTVAWPMTQNWIQKHAHMQLDRPKIKLVSITVVRLGGCSDDFQTLVT